MLPRCTYCDSYIKDDFVYDIEDELICETCLNDNFKKPIQDYIE